MLSVDALYKNMRLSSLRDLKFYSLLYVYFYQHRNCKSRQSPVVIRWGISAATGVYFLTHILILEWDVFDRSETSRSQTSSSSDD